MHYASPISKKDDILKIEIYDRDAIGEDDLEGIVTISMTELLHQQRVDDWIGLKRPDGEEEMGFLRIRLQFVWSKLQLCSDILAKSQDQLERIESDINQIIKYLDLIVQPFGIILLGEILNLLESKILEKGEESIHYSDNQKNYLASSKIAMNESLAMKLDNVFKGVLSKKV